MRDRDHKKVEGYVRGAKPQYEQDRRHGRERRQHEPERFNRQYGLCVFLIN